MTISAVLFDLDGLLADTEPLWREAEVKALNQLGIPLSYEMTFQTNGIRVDEVAMHWAQIFQVNHISPEIMVSEIIRELNLLIKQKVDLKPGVIDILKFFRNEGIPMGVASSSSLSIIQTVLVQTGILDQFIVIQSAENEKYGKPHPAVYLAAAHAMGVNPFSILAFEDSIHGMKAAKNAGMKVVVVPESNLCSLPGFNEADVKLASLSDFTMEIWDKLKNTIM